MKVIQNISIDSQSVSCNGSQLFDLSNIPDADILVHLYRSRNISYPKFFKMDRISKLGFLAVELLLQNLDTTIKKDTVALLITTADGCREVDEKFEQSRNDIPSPGLFVYTLPNIVLGEICIRNGFKGEQMVWITASEDKKLTQAYISSLFSKGNTSACIVGFINAYKDDLRCDLSWVEHVL